MPADEDDGTEEVGQGAPDLEGRGQEIRERLRAAVRSLDQVPVKSELEAEIIGRLIDARLTVSELVNLIYGTQRQDDEFFAYYMKVKRAMKSLASRGLVSTRLFGRDKPYALTPHGVKVLANIGGGVATETKLLPKIDLGLYTATAALAATTLGLAGWGQPSHGTILVASSLLFFLIGIAFTRAVQSIKKVF
jgi:hypothetical protein